MGVARHALALAFVALLSLGCAVAPGQEDEPEGTTTPRAEGRPEQLRFEPLRVLPHDATSFTQGLVWQDGVLYESVGQYGRSALIAWSPVTGEVEERTALPPSLFGEGLAVVGEELVQLTWRTGIALRWSLPPFRKLGEHRYTGEGWGLTTDPASGRLVMSDGTDRLLLRDPETFEVLDTLRVTDGAGQPVRFLNELEYAEGFIYANLWTTETIVQIDPGTGVVTAEIDASGLLDGVPVGGADVLNGIAYDPESQTFWLTGKLWPLIFEGVFVEGQGE
jgi:glutaminyl-peptide cyclotransferase